jgi:hypothetical protein
MNFVEHTPTFMCVVQESILDDAQGGRGWLENAPQFGMAVEELPLGPFMEVPTANRDRH